MTMAQKPLEDLIHELPPSMQAEVRDFVEFLLTKLEQPTNRKLRQDWAGALEAYQQQYTALDLQHLATKWRTE
jgi:hypothetical protein